MGKVVVAEFVSLDGFIQDPAWTAPFWHDRIGDFKSAELQEAEALLLGRSTYQMFAASWPNHPEQGAYKDKMNAMPKYVATTTLTQLEWNAQRIEGEVTEGIAKLRTERNLLVFGSGTLVDYLRAHELVDEYRLVIYPVLLGNGLRLFNLTEVEATLTLNNSQALDNGVLLATYRVSANSVTRPSFG
ncbi:dihydrofolate reductase family protein [Nocardia sp. CDC159]|uniref:Dihydrofolate reductase family protein n=1 Tax=Nocardia pulmonis TaxID=2951408 RepID=A0A9X2EAY5_9NOCA|nr:MULTISPECIES: dihydrofolate reductase family protein [Nocardia]MCM6777554.1 dihydrofolate reductase family protein [Nocardia pulmonis]MCM6790339.1 dihydrofolate reductase family protein [Nocardia sp. CDC159]